MALRYRTALVGRALTVAVLCAASGRLEAKPYRVRIESQPSGATVYLDSKDGEPLGQTPLTDKVPAGTHTLIVELDGYVSQVQDIKIRKNRKVQRIAVRLSKIDLATIEVVPDQGAPGGRDLELRGARILVDGRDAGNLPDSIQVPAGPHQVEVVKEGYKTFETWVETAQGERLRIPVALTPVASRRTAAGKGAAAEQATGRSVALGSAEEERFAAAEGGDTEAPPDTSIDRRAGEARRAREVPFFTVGAGFELGGRRFRPNAKDVQGLREYDAGGVLMVRFAAELNPLAFSPSKWISGWGLYGSYGRATPLDSTARLMSGDEVNVPTVWSEVDLGARYRYRFQPDGFVGLQVGYGTHTFTFNFSQSTQELAAEVPDVDYKFWRVGMEGRYGFGRLAAIASGGTRLVSSIGNLADRFTKTDILALNAAAGVAARVTKSIEARLVGHYDHYAHEYTQMASNPASTARSGVDQFYGAMLSALFQY